MLESYKKQDEEANEENRIRNVLNERHFSHQNGSKTNYANNMINVIVVIMR